MLLKMGSIDYPTSNSGFTLHLYTDSWVKVQEGAFNQLSKTGLWKLQSSDSFGSV